MKHNHDINTIAIPADLLRLPGIPLVHRIVLAYAADPWADPLVVCDLAGILRPDGETPDRDRLRAHRWRAVRRGLLRRVTTEDWRGDEVAGWEPTCAGAADRPTGGSNRDEHPETLLRPGVVNAPELLARARAIQTNT